MSCDIMDSDGTKMRVTMFNNEIDLFEPHLQLNSTVFIRYSLILFVVFPQLMFLLSKGTVKPANKKFNTLGNDYEMTLDKNSIVEAAPDQGDVPLQSYKFVAIADLSGNSSPSFFSIFICFVQGYEADKIVDVIGVITEVGELTSINTKKGFVFVFVVRLYLHSSLQGNPLSKRTMTILDSSLASIELTLWGKHAESEYSDGIIVVQGNSSSSFFLSS